MCFRNARKKADKQYVYYYKKKRADKLSFLLSSIIREIFTDVCEQILARYHEKQKH